VQKQGGGYGGGRGGNAAATAGNLDNTTFANVPAHQRAAMEKQQRQQAEAAQRTQMNKNGYGAPPRDVGAAGPTPHRELAAQRKAANRRALAAMMLMPWLFFTAVVLMYAFLYHSSPGVCLLMVAQLVFISFLFVIFDVRASHT